MNETDERCCYQGTKERGVGVNGPAFGLFVAEPSALSVITQGLLSDDPISIIHKMCERHNDAEACMLCT